MLFNSFEFILYFLPAALVAYYACRAAGLVRISVATLAFASVFFYGWWDWRNLFILGTSVAFNYIVGRRTARRDASARAWLIVGVAGNLLALGVFKYYNFFATNFASLTGVTARLLEFALPLGISFFTFTQIAFLVDTWRGKAREYRFLEYLLFVSYFPHLIAGPIIHHKQLIPQLDRRFGLPKVLDDFGLGLLIFVLGLAKKVLLADNIAPFANVVFSAAADGKAIDPVSAWAGVLAYTLQLYFDFSGYSDMAVGLSKMFGINLPINFNAPYRATSVIDFWRRWHMTLSRFLRDYLYISLGGNRLGKVRRYVNLLVTMLLGGLWHGAGWTFIIWGAIHGTALAANHLWRSVAPAWWRRAPLSVTGTVGWGLTFFVAVIGWVYFRAHDVASANRLMAAMFTPQAGIVDGLVATLRQSVHTLLTFGWLDILLTLLGPSANYVPGFGLIASVQFLMLLPFLIVLSAAGPTALVVACRIRHGFAIPGWFAQARGFAAVGAIALLLFICLGRMNNATEFLYFQF